MKRNMDLVRRILLAIETHPRGFAPDIALEGYSAEEIGYHLTLMAEAGLVEADDVTGIGDAGPMARVSRLTWQGHEFLEDSRSPRIWEQAKTVVTEAGGGSFQIWQAVLADLIKKNLGLS